MNLDRAPIGLLARLMRRMAFNLDGKHRKAKRKPTGDRRKHHKGSAKPDGWKSLSKTKRKMARESRRRNRAA